MSENLNVKLKMEASLQYLQIQRTFIVKNKSKAIYFHFLVLGYKYLFHELSNDNNVTTQ